MINSILLGQGQGLQKKYSKQMDVPFLFGKFRDVEYVVEVESIWDSFCIRRAILPRQKQGIQIRHLESS